MSIAETFTILSTAIAALVAEASLLWWTYRRGEQAGGAKAKIADLERQLAETRAELASLQPKRRRV